MHVTKTFICDVDRYGDIALRWPLTISVKGTEEQIEHFMTHGLPYEAGCDDLYIDPDEII